MSDMDAFYEEQRALLQRILESPATECEKAFREIELRGMSQPKEWEPGLCGMHGLMWHTFQRGWKAYQVQPRCRDGEDCVCGRDPVGVRESCPCWRESAYETIP